MGNCFRTASQIVDPVETRLEHVSVGVPDYDKFQTSTIATGKRGKAPGELNSPQGVAIDEDTHQIFVANDSNNRVEIFSETGEYICQLGEGQLNKPWGIAIHGDNVYVSSCNDHTVSRFSLTDMSLVRKIGGGGSKDGEFMSPKQLTTDSTGRVFIADTYNYRICIHDPNLNHLYNITLESMSQPTDVKISRDHLYVLCLIINPCILVLTLEGDKLHSLITRGEMSYPRFFFCLDPLNNFVISDFRSYLIRVFSPEGNLLHTIGREGHQPGMFYQPSGVAINPNGRLVSLSNMYYCLRIFW